jgi:N-methylhydantoinase A
VRRGRAATDDSQLLLFAQRFPVIDDIVKVQVGGTNTQATGVCADGKIAQAQHNAAQTSQAIDCRSDLQRHADVRYVGQNYELTVSIGEERLTTVGLEALVAEFHAAHERAYGFASPAEPVQIVTLRIEARGPIEPFRPFEVAEIAAGTAPDAIDLRSTYFQELGTWIDCPTFDRGQLCAGHVLNGPAIIEQMDTTTMVLPGQRATVDRLGNLIIQESEEAAR